MSESGEAGARAEQVEAPLRVEGFTPDNLQIAGLVSLSTVDRPGRPVALVFYQGCPWKYLYCQNSVILDPKIPGVTAWSAVEDLLSRRHGLPDGVVLSGGETTRQLAPLSAIRRAKGLNFHVGLHAADAYPKRLETILEEGLIDWVGVDVKATLENCKQVSGRAGAAEKAWASLDLVLAHPGATHEVRLIVYPGGPFDGLEIVRKLKERGVRVFTLQQAQAFGALEGFEVKGVSRDSQVATLTCDYTTPGFDNFEFRSD